MDSARARSQSETVGVVLLLGITLLSVGALATFGSAAIDGTQHSVDVQSAEHALSQLDSRVSLVALSDAERQYVSLGRGREGSYSVDPDEGRITITHLNYTANEEPDDDRVLYDDSLGAVRYETGETTLAYQGGGVWRSEASGGSTMVSTPEFHYRGMTLTLPIIRVAGDGSISGNARANVYSETSSVAIYPEAAENYTNPVKNGTIQIAVQSDYYRAWGDYFESRTDGEVSIDHENETAIVELVSIGTDGNFNMPMDGESIEFRALSAGHPLSNFTINITPDQPDSQGFTQLSWSIYAESGNQQFETHLSTSGSTDCNDNVSATVFYTDGSNQQGWKDDDAFEVTCDADGSNPRIEADLLGNTTMEYSAISSNEIMVFDARQDLAEPVTFDQHGDSIGWESDGGTTFSQGETTTLGNVTNHYVGLLAPNVDLTIEDGEGVGNAKSSEGYVDEESSTGFVKTNSTGQYVTYLHISENNVTVDIE